MSFLPSFCASNENTELSGVDKIRWIMNILDWPTMDASAADVRNELEQMKLSCSYPTFKAELEQITKQIIEPITHLSPSSLFSSSKPIYLSASESEFSEEQDAIVGLNAKFIVLLAESSPISLDFASVFTEELDRMCPLINCRFKDEEAPSDDQLKFLSLFFQIVRFKAQRTQDQAEIDFQTGIPSLWKWMAYTINHVHANPTNSNLFPVLEVFVNCCSQIMYKTYRKQFLKAMQFLYDDLVKVESSDECSQIAKLDAFSLRSKLDLIRL